MDNMKKLDDLTEKELQEKLNEIKAAIFDLDENYRMSRPQLIQSAIEVQSQINLKKNSKSK